MLSATAKKPPTDPNLLDRLDPGKPPSLDPRVRALNGLICACQASVTSGIAWGTREVVRQTLVDLYKEAVHAEPGPGEEIIVETLADLCGMAFMGCSHAVVECAFVALKSGLNAAARGAGYQNPLGGMPTGAKFKEYQKWAVPLGWTAYAAMKQYFAVTGHIPPARTFSDAMTPDLTSFKSLMTLAVAGAIQGIPYFHAAYDADGLGVDGLPALSPLSLTDLAEKAWERAQAGFTDEVELYGWRFPKALIQGVMPVGLDAMKEIGWSDDAAAIISTVVTGFVHFDRVDTFFTEKARNEKREPASHPDGAFKKAAKDLAVAGATIGMLRGFGVDMTHGAAEDNAFAIATWGAAAVLMTEAFRCAMREGDLLTPKADAFSELLNAALVTAVVTPVAGPVVGFAAGAAMPVLRTLEKPVKGALRSIGSFLGGAPADPLVLLANDAAVAKAGARVAAECAKLVEGSAAAGTATPEALQAAWESFRAALNAAEKADDAALHAGALVDSLEAKMQAAILSGRAAATAAAGAAAPADGKWAAAPLDEGQLRKLAAVAQAAQAGAKEATKKAVEGSKAGDAAKLEARDATVSALAAAASLTKYARELAAQFVADAQRNPTRSEAAKEVCSTALDIAEAANRYALELVARASFYSRDACEGVERAEAALRNANDALALKAQQLQFAIDQKNQTAGAEVDHRLAERLAVASAAAAKTAHAAAKPAIEATGRAMKLREAVARDMAAVDRLLGEAQRIRPTLAADLVVLPSRVYLPAGDEDGVDGKRGSPSSSLVPEYSIASQPSRPSIPSYIPSDSEDSRERPPDAELRGSEDSVGEGSMLRQSESHGEGEHVVVIRTRG